MTDQPSNNPRIGLTGGIAAGKSTVARRLADEHGALIIDADAIVRKLQEPGGRGLAAIVAEFGEDMLTADGTLDRARLGALIFNDEGARARLNAIIHPMVREEAQRIADSAAPGQLIIEDIPLLVESGQAGRFDHVMVVEAPLAERVRRMVEDRGMSEGDAHVRIKAQATDEQRREVASHVLVNHGSVDELHQAVDAAVASILAVPRHADSGRGTD